MIMNGSGSSGWGDENTLGSGCGSGWGDGNGCGSGWGEIGWGYGRKCGRGYGDGTGDGCDDINETKQISFINKIIVDKSELMCII